MIEHPAAVLARHLAAHAEDVCRHYLSNGSRAGRYWLVGDVHNSKGRSLYVRLDGPLAGPGAVGKWTDDAPGEPGDLLDLIRLRCAFRAGGAALDEASSEARRVGKAGVTPFRSRWSPVHSKTKN